MWKVLVIVCALAFNLKQIEAQGEGSDCETPNNLPGVCINIYYCDPLISLLRSNSRDARVVRFLQESQCGFAGKQPLVCCAVKTQTIPTVRPPTAPPTERTTQRVTQRPTQEVTQRPTQRTTERYVEKTTESDNGNGKGYKLPRWPYCGLRNESMNVKVVGGRDAILGEIPWIVALGYKNEKNLNNPRWLCGGSLITEKHVLTAGHCLRPDLYLVRAGDLDLYSDDDGTQPVNIPVARMIRHEQYSAQQHTNDIALVVLSRPAKGYLIAPVCLPIDEPLRSQTFDNFTPMVAGWGSVYFRGPSSAHLQVVQLPVVAPRTCSNSYANFRGATIDDRVLCAGHAQGEQDSCEGDSGGPLIISSRKDTHVRMYQIGVVSYGHKCAEPGYPGVYTRVTRFVDWIERNLVDE